MLLAIAGVGVRMHGQDEAERLHGSRDGELGAQSEKATDDACRASCVDWYGNARPIFLRERTFALMGYELVEGEIGARAIHEVQRINFAPPHGERERER
jgi:hypothetical protein